MPPRARQVLVLVALAASACTWGSGSGLGPTRASTTSDGAPIQMPDPCPGTRGAELGNPDVGGPVAEFTVDAGGRFWVTARTFSHGGVLDPEVGRTAIWIGSLEALPTYDEQRSSVSNTQVRTDVVEHTWSAVDLQPGGQWLWTSTGSDIVVKSCEGTRVATIHRVDKGGVGLPPGRGSGDLERSAAVLNALNDGRGSR